VPRETRAPARRARARVGPVEAGVVSRRGYTTIFIHGRAARLYRSRVEAERFNKTQGTFTISPVRVVLPGRNLPYWQVMVLE